MCKSRQACKAMCRDASRQGRGEHFSSFTSWGTSADALSQHRDRYLLRWYLVALVFAWAGGWRKQDVAGSCEPKWQQPVNSTSTSETVEYIASDRTTTFCYGLAMHNYFTCHLHLFAIAVEHTATNKTSAKIMGGNHEDDNARLALSIGPNMQCTKIACHASAWFTVMLHSGFLILMLQEVRSTFTSCMVQSQACLDHDAHPCIIASVFQLQVK